MGRSRAARQRKVGMGADDSQGNGNRMRWLARLRSAAIAAISLTALANCDGETKVVCPAGYHAEGTYCYEDAPIPAQDTVGGDSAEPQDTGGATDAAATDTVKDSDSSGKDGSGDGSATDGGSGDTKADSSDIKADTKPGGKSPVGAACSDDYDCLSGLTCFNWPKGYCTVANCDAPGANCPGSSVCYGEVKTNQLCHAACDLNEDCRSADGYACKRYSAEFGGMEARLCAPGGKNATGLGCAKPSDCAGANTCLTDMAGGYCARLGCGGSDPCSSGEACVLRNGKPVCLRTCVADVECAIGGNFPRKCVDKTDLTKKPVKVCLDSTKSAPVGAACLADLDCDTKLCSIFAKGSCTTGGLPCLSDMQCGAAGPCVLDPAKEKGVCTAPCSADTKCPAGAVCVPGKDKTSGSCQPACKGPGDDAACGGVPGLVCLYGSPIPAGGNPASPTYACAPLAAGSAGAQCTQTKDCVNALCLTNDAQNAGYCAPSCGSAAYCPFGSLCDGSGLAQCLKMCSVEFDCPPQMKCGAISGLAGKVCLPP
jgi:hypothetical protein